ncbi:MAG TPA: hypothetical protein VFE24_02520 [Pirellulales bacterium]|jgi:hypothetical protein|nr:hypothetical protein [Pirellulales bacterium]
MIEISEMLQIQEEAKQPRASQPRHAPPGSSGATAIEIRNADGQEAGNRLADAPTKPFSRPGSIPRKHEPAARIKKDCKEHENTAARSELLRAAASQTEINYNV